MKNPVLIILLSLFSLHGCQSMQTTSKLSDSIYLDHAFDKSNSIESPKEVLYVSPEMKRYLNTRLAPLKSAKEISARLIRDFFDPDIMNIGYAHNANYTASETFVKGLANCMSLTLLSYVLINQTGLDASFMDVKMEENWSLQNGRTMLNGHVNLRVSDKHTATNIVLFKKEYTIDFLPMIGIPVISQTKLNDDEIIAMYYNNKGGEALANNDTNRAYQYFKAGTKLAPNKAAIWSNLASLYRQSGLLTEAEDIYLHAIKLEPNSLNIKENLAILYNATHRTAQAQKLKKEVENKRINNPYYHAMLAEEAFYRGNFTQSLSHYKKAISINNKEHRFYFGLARTYLNLGKYDNVVKSLKRAKRLADAIQDKNKYQNKISALASLNASL